MNNSVFKSKKFFILGAIFILVIVFFLVFLNKGLKQKAIKIFEKKEESVVDVVSGEDFEKYSGQIFAYFEGKWILNFSFLHKKDLKVSQGVGDQSKWFKVINKDGKNNVTLYFTYEGGRGWNAEDYINDIADKSRDYKIQDGEIIRI